MNYEPPKSLDQASIWRQPIKNGRASVPFNNDSAGSISPITMGCARLGAFWQRHGIREGTRAVEAALAEGVTTFDTADVYARGLSEYVLGRTLRQHSGGVVISKVGQIKTPRAAFRSAQASRSSLLSSSVGLGRTPTATTDGVPRCWEADYISRSVEASLKRLRRPRLEVLLLHSPSMQALTERRFAPAVQEMLTSGDIARFGVSCDSPEVAERALENTDVSVLQVEYNLMHSAAISDVLSHAVRRGVAVLGRAPYAGGRIPGLVRLSDAGVREFDEDIATAALRFAASGPGVVSTVVGMSNARNVRRTSALMRRELSPERYTEILERYQQPN